MLIVYLLIPWMMLTLIENRMTHDFATVPRYVEPLGAVQNNSAHKEGELHTSSFSVNSPFQLRWILVAVSCLILWFFLQPAALNVADVTPDQGEIIEFQQEMAEAYLVDDVQVGDVKEVSKKETVNTAATFSSPKVVSSTVPVDDIDDIVQYGFYDNLRDSQWAVQTQNGAYVSRELATRKKAKYKLQAASFRGEQDAKRLVKKLSKYGLKARTRVSVSTNGVEWYQVNVGPFSNVSKMNKAQDVLVSLNMMPLKRKI